MSWWRVFCITKVRILFNVVEKSLSINLYLIKKVLEILIILLRWINNLCDDREYSTCTGTYIHFFSVSQNLRKCETFLICVSHILWFKKFLIAINTTYNFWVLNNLRCKRDCEKSDNWIIAKITRQYSLLKNDCWTVIKVYLY